MGVIAVDTYTDRVRHCQLQSCGAPEVVVCYDANQVQPETIAERVTGSGYGSSINQVVTPDQYASMTGKSMAAVRKGGGCGSGCCGSKQPREL